MSPHKYYKVLIINGSDVTSSVLHLLTDSKVVEPQLLSSKSDVNQGNSMYNLIECSEAIADGFISERCIFLLPYNSEGNLEDIVHQLHSVIVKILCKVMSLTLQLMADGNEDFF